MAEQTASISRSVGQMIHVIFTRILLITQMMDQRIDSTVYVRVLK